nr:MAG TPA: hypothetical protein [Caudoviricetes sp.]
MTKIDKELIDTMAQLEVNALLEGLKDPELRRNPAFLEKVRKFLQQNQLTTQPDTIGVDKIKKLTTEIPVFKDEIN